VTTLDVRSVAVQRGGQRLVDGVSFSARQGELLAIMGASGSGKTTVLRSIAGLDPLAAGTIDVSGVRLTAGNTLRGGARRSLHRSVGIVFQFHHLFSHMSALDNVALAPVHVLGRARAEVDDRARELLAALGVGARAAAMPHELSGGEAQRVSLARTLANSPEVLLLDESTSALDEASARGIEELVLNIIRERQMTCVMVTHNMEQATRMADRTMYLEAAKLVAIVSTNGGSHVS
jgi:ABC-type polar amino acid transport system ATPase subunit